MANDNTATAANPIGKVAVSGYGRIAVVPKEDEKLTHVGFGTPMGELLRRYWQPICLSDELTDLPKAVKILGEELVVFRNKKGVVGVLDAHCAHRGTSLEYGRIEEDGIRCCYHGWYFSNDGTCLQQPGEPEGSTYFKEVFQPAYPVQEYHGLVFIYMGPPDKQPLLPRYENLEREDVQVVAYRNFSRGVVAEMNWLQVHENVMDPVHTAFLHSTISTTHFTKAFAVIPKLGFKETEIGMQYIRTSKQKTGRTFVRVQELHVPNVRVVSEAILSEEVHVQQAPVIGYWVPVDDTHTIGFHLEALRIVDGKVIPSNLKNAPVGRTADGNAPRTSYEDTQREPDDAEAQGSQRRIAVHALENRGTTDAGVVMCRRLLREAMRDIEQGRDPIGIIRSESQLPIKIIARNEIQP